MKVYPIFCLKITMTITLALTVLGHCFICLTIVGVICAFSCKSLCVDISKIVVAL